MDYFHKYDTNPFPDLAWNIPDQKKGSLLVLGGHAQSFKNVVKSAETLAKNFPIEDLKLALPETLKNTLPPLPGLIFLPMLFQKSFILPTSTCLLATFPRTILPPAPLPKSAK